VQGYEDIALRWLTQIKNVDPETIQGVGDVPAFSYSYKGKLRRYRPDFQVDDKIVEVKSLWTAGLIRSQAGFPDSFESLKRKYRVVTDSGYQFKLLLFKQEGECFYTAKIPKGWNKLSRKEFLRSLAWEDTTLKIRDRER
jgi:hypothetical protein